MAIELKLTPVFQWNWEAIHAIDPETGERKYRYIINTGSSRSSKTTSLIDLIDIYARKNKSKRITVWRKTKVNCKETVGDDMLKHHKNTGRYEKKYKHNQTKFIFNYDNGSSIEITGTDNSLKVHGLNQSVAWLNEPYDIVHEVFKQIDKRTEDFIIMDWNPSMAHFIDKLILNPRTIVINSTFLDNPFCPREEKIQIQSTQPVSMCDAVESGKLTEIVARYYDCDINILELTEKQCKELRRCQHNENIETANAYDWSVYGLGRKAEKPHRIFKWKKISPDEYRALNLKEYFGCDWGKVDPWGVIGAKYKDGRLYLRELNYASEDLHRKNMSSTTKKQIDSRDAGAEDKDYRNGIVTWLFESLGIPYDANIICDNNRPKKILALRNAGWDYADPADGLKSIKDGIDLLLNLEVFFTSDSENIDYEQQNYSHKKDRNGNVLEDPEDKNNHAIDPARYIVQWLEREGIINIV